jgi:hypothetical protein
MARRKLAHAQHEREKLLQAYFADALPLEVFKREQTRIAKEIDSAQAEIAEAESTDSPYREMLVTALSYMRDAQRGYAQAALGSDPDRADHDQGRRPTPLEPGASRHPAQLDWLSIAPIAASRALSVAASHTFTPIRSSMCTIGVPMWFATTASTWCSWRKRATRA